MNVFEILRDMAETTGPNLNVEPYAPTWPLVIEGLAPVRPATDHLKARRPNQLNSERDRLVMLLPEDYRQAATERLWADPSLARHLWGLDHSVISWADAMERMGVHL
jgi:hypothetical protein